MCRSSKASCWPTGTIHSKTTRCNSSMNVRSASPRSNSTLSSGRPRSGRSSVSLLHHFAEAFPSPSEANARNHARAYFGGWAVAMFFTRQTALSRTCTYCSKPLTLHRRHPLPILPLAPLPPLQQNIQHFHPAPTYPVGSVRIRSDRSGRPGRGR